MYTKLKRTFRVYFQQINKTIADLISCEMRNAYKMFVQRLEGNRSHRSLGRLR